MFSLEKRAALKSSLLVLLGGLTAVVATEIKTKKELSQTNCQLRLMLIADKVKPLFVLPIRDTEAEAIIGMISMSEKVIIRLTKTNGSFLLEDQCTRPDGNKALMEVKREEVVSK